MERLSKIIYGLNPTLVMIVAQIMFAGGDIFYKFAAIDGINFSVLIAYRYLFAAVFMLLVATFVERSKGLKLTWIVIFQGFLSGLIGATLVQQLYFRGLALTSASYARAITNLLPALTFLFAIIFRLENLGLNKLSGKAKVAGTITGLIGAMTLTFYKGPSFNIPNPDVNLLSKIQHQSGHTHSDHVVGVCFTVASCLCYTFWLILQSKMNERYPYPYSSIALMNIMAAIICTTFTLCTERDWKLGWNSGFFTAAYMGIICSGVVSTMMAWCLQVRGPIFVSAFNPLALLPVLIAGFLLLDEKLHLGSLLGTIMIVCGLYIVLWGKEKEMKKNVELLSSAELGDMKTVGG